MVGEKLCVMSKLPTTFDRNVLMLPLSAAPVNPLESRNSVPH